MNRCITTTQGFHEAIKAYHHHFGIPVSTLQKWEKSDNRVGHRCVLQYAFKAICSSNEWERMLDEREPMEMARALGFSNPQTLKIGGVSNRTLRSWFQSPDKHKQLNVFMLGHYWLLLETLACEAQFGSVQNLLDFFASKSVKGKDLVQLYLVNPTATVSIATQQKRLINA